MNEKTIHHMNDIHVGRNARKTGLLQSSILPHVCAGGAGMFRSMKIILLDEKKFDHEDG